MRPITGSDRSSGGLQTARDRQPGQLAADDADRFFDRPAWTAACPDGTGSGGHPPAHPDGAAVLDALANQLKPGDVVLVKASRAAHLEGVAEVLRAGGDDPPSSPRRRLEEADR